MNALNKLFIVFVLFALLAICQAKSTYELETSPVAVQGTDFTADTGVLSIENELEDVEEVQSFDEQLRNFFRIVKPVPSKKSK